MIGEDDILQRLNAWRSANASEPRRAVAAVDACDQWDVLLAELKRIEILLRDQRCHAREAECWQDAGERSLAGEIASECFVGRGVLRQLLGNVACALESSERG